MISPKKKCVVVVMTKNELLGFMHARTIAPATIAHVALEATEAAQDPRVQIALAVDTVPEALESYGAQIVSNLVVPDGYTQIDFVARDRKSGLILIGAAADAKTNPNFKSFAVAFAAKNFDAQGAVIGTKTGRVNIFGQSPQRKVYALKGNNKFDEVPLPAKDAQIFTTANGVLGFIQSGGTQVMGVRIAKIAERIDAGTLAKLAWRGIGTLAHPVVAITRDDHDNGTVLIATEAGAANDDTLNYEGYKFTLEKTGDAWEISMISVDEAITVPLSDDGVLLSYAGNGQGNVFARPDGSVQLGQTSNQALAAFLAKLSGGQNATRTTQQQ